MHLTGRAPWACHTYMRQVVPSLLCFHTVPASLTKTPARSSPPSPLAAAAAGREERGVAFSFLVFLYADLAWVGRPGGEAQEPQILERRAHSPS